MTFEDSRVSLAPSTEPRPIPGVANQFLLIRNKILDESQSRAQPRRSTQILNSLKSFFLYCLSFFKESFYIMGMIDRQERSRWLPITAQWTFREFFLYTKWGHNGGKGVGRDGEKEKETRRKRVNGENSKKLPHCSIWYPAVSDLFSEMWLTTLSGLLKG